MSNMKSASLPEPTGVLYIDKPKGITSHDVVNRIRRLYQTRRVGHTGTLDPMASGVMVVLVGRAAKAAEFVMAEDKGYFAGLQLGVTTDTGDVTGKILTQATGEWHPSFLQVQEIAQSFLGDIMQTPPMYSALKIQGQKLVDLARQGIEIERQPRPIHVSRLEMQALEGTDDRYQMTVECSKGTYIRVLCEDIGRALGCGGTMCSLRRFRSGTVTLEHCITLEMIENTDASERYTYLHPIEALFCDLPVVTLSPFFARLAHAGCEIYLKKIGVLYPLGQRITLADDEGFFALGEVAEYPDGAAIRPIRQFRLATSEQR